MAEFDSSAFSAVDSFFKIDKEPSKDASSTKRQSSTNTGKNNKRLGVGAATKPEPQKKVDTTSRLLQVGKKKRKNDNFDDDEDVELVAAEDDDEEELGRSGIATEAPKEVEQEAKKAKKKKKKKAGKKEREKQKEAEQAENTDEAEENNDPAIESSNTESKEGQRKDNADKNDIDTTKQEKTDNPNKPKRKRRKVRSRQKNIYKDNRTANQRPDHLVPGGFDYKGRPMTSATRSKLEGKNLLSTDRSNYDNGGDKDAIRANWDTTDQELQDNGIPVLGNAKVLDRSDGAIRPRNGKPKKKSKYKNMR